MDQLAHTLASLPDGAHALQLTPAACTAALVQGLVSALLALGAPDWQNVPEERGTAVEPGDVGQLHGRAGGVSFCGKVSLSYRLALLRLSCTCRAPLRVPQRHGLAVGEVDASCLPHGCCRP